MEQFGKGNKQNLEKKMIQTEKNKKKNPKTKKNVNCTNHGIGPERK